MTLDAQQKVLDALGWYRLLKILAIFILISSFFVSASRMSRAVGIIDVTITVGTWWLLIYMIKRSIVYIKFGKPLTNSYVKQKYYKIAKYAGIVMLLFIIFSIVLLYLPAFFGG